MDDGGQLEVHSLDGLNIDEPVILVKIDVEGMEREVLRGGINLIQKNRPYIMIESFPDVFQETRDILLNMGYAYERVDAINWVFSPV